MKSFKKKSQLYLLTAIILSVLVFVMADFPSKTQDAGKEPIMMFNNLVSESPRVINSAIYQDRNLTEDFDDFTDKFIHHGEAKNINISLFYILIYNNNMTISNKMGDSVNITTDSGKRVLSDNQNITMARKNIISVDFNGIHYPFDINTDETQFKLIFMTKDILNNTEVYTYG